MNTILNKFSGLYSFFSKSARNLTIRTRILGLFLIIITVSVLIVASSTFYIGSQSMESTIANQLNNSVRFVIDQITLLSGAYNSRQFSDKLNYVLTEEQASFSQAGLKSQIYLIDSAGMEINRENVKADTNKKSNLPESFITQVLKKKSGSMDIKLEGEQKTIAFGYIIEKDWIYAVAVSKASYLKVIYKLQAFTIGSGIIAILLALVLSFIGSRGIINSIRNINKTVLLADKGNLTSRSEARNGGPEMRELSEKLNMMLSNFEGMITEIGLSIEELTVSSESLINISSESDESSSYIHSLTQEMAASLEEENNFILHIKESTDKVTTIIRSITQQINGTLKASSIMMEVVYEGLNAIKELSSKITDIEEVADSSVNHIKVLEARTKEITKITNTIKGISDQTKLLSLNAAIEAARAGEFGAGFTVVAQEIQKLAHSSAQSAFEVEEIIKEVQKDTGSVLEVANRSRTISHEGTVIAQKTDNAFNMILNKVTETHGHINNISANASSISENLQVFEENIENIVGIISETAEKAQEVSATVESHKSLSGGIFTSAEHLLSMAQKLNKLKDKYITG